MSIDERGRGQVSRLWAGRLDPARQQVARFHREPDRRRLRAMAAGSLCATVFMLGVLGIVGLKVQQVRLSYRLDALRATSAQTEEQNRRLRVELATLSALARIDDRARKELGMVLPGRDQVQLAREFVTGGRGVSSVRPPRTASAQRLSSGEASVR